MATAATSLLGLALPVTGELSGTWGDTVNVSITALLDTAVAGTTTLSSDADVTLTTTTLAANQARQAIILWTAGGTVTRTITVPAQSKSYIVINKTSSSQSIKIVGAGPTTGVTIVAGTAAFVVWNGVDFVTASVTSTTGILPVANGGTGLTAGTSGGVLAYTATGTLASSAALAASALVIGGGAGAAPSTTTTGTGVVTALGVNVGTAGAFVVNGGALGTPSSGTVTNLTGTASININGTVGATTPGTGAFTTLSATGIITSTVTSGQVLRAESGTTGILYSNFINTGGTFLYGIDNSAGTAIFSGSSAYAGFIGTTTATSLVLATNSVARGVFSTTGLAVTGALSATGTLSGGTSGTAYSFSGSAPATSLTLTSGGNLLVGSSSSYAGKFQSWGAVTANAGTPNVAAIDTTSVAQGVGGELAFIGQFQSGDYAYFGSIRGIKENATSGDTACALTFFTRPTATAPVERARIDSSGNLLVGKTSGGGAVGPRVEVDNTNNTSGDNGLFVYLGGNCSNTSSSAFSSLITGVGNKFHVYGNGNVVNTNNSYGAISDVKFKENIVDATPKLNDVLNLKVRNFNLKTEPNNKQIGFIAQEFEEVFPSMIDVSPDTDVNGKTLETTHKSIKLSVLVPILVKAIQEQQALITQLTARVAQLESKP